MMTSLYDKDPYFVDKDHSHSELYDMQNKTPYYQDSDGIKNGSLRGHVPSRSMDLQSTHFMHLPSSHLNGLNEYNPEDKNRNNNGYPAWKVINKRKDIDFNKQNGGSYYRERELSHFHDEDFDDEDFNNNKYIGYEQNHEEDTKVLNGNTLPVITNTNGNYQNNIGNSITEENKGLKDNITTFNTGNTNNDNNKLNTNGNNNNINIDGSTTENMLGTVGGTNKPRINPNSMEESLYLNTSGSVVDPNMTPIGNFSGVDNYNENIGILHGKNHRYDTTQEEIDGRDTREVLTLDPNNGKSLRSRYPYLTEEQIKQVLAQIDLKPDRLRDTQSGEPTNKNFRQVWSCVRPIVCHKSNTPFYAQCSTAKLGYCTWCKNLRRGNQKQGSICMSCGERLTAKYHRWYPELVRLEPLQRTRNKDTYRAYKPLLEHFNITWHDEKGLDFVVNHYMLMKIWVSDEKFDIRSMHLERVYMIGVFAGREFNTGALARKLLREGCKLVMFRADFPEYFEYLRDQRAAVAEKLNTMFFEGKNPCYFHAHHTNIEGWYEASYLSRELIVEKFNSLCNQVIQQMARPGDSLHPKLSRHFYGLNKVLSNGTQASSSDDGITGAANLNDASLGMGGLSLGSTTHNSGMNGNNMNNLINLNSGLGLRFVPGIGNVATNNLLSNSVNVLPPNTNSQMMINSNSLQPVTTNPLQMMSSMTPTVGNSSTTSVNTLGTMNMMPGMNPHVPPLASTSFNVMNTKTTNNNNNDVGAIRIPLGTSAPRVMNMGIGSMNLNIHPSQITNDGNDQLQQTNGSGVRNVNLNLNAVGNNNNVGFSGTVTGNETLDHTFANNNTSQMKILLQNTSSNHDGNSNSDNRKRGNIHVIDGNSNLGNSGNVNTPPLNSYQPLAFRNLQPSEAVAQVSASAFSSANDSVTNIPSVTRVESIGSMIRASSQTSLGYLSPNASAGGPPTMTRQLSSGTAAITRALGYEGPMPGQSSTAFLNPATNPGSIDVNSNLISHPGSITSNLPFFSPTRRALLSPDITLTSGKKFDFPTQTNNLTAVNMPQLF